MYSSLPSRERGLKLINYLPAIRKYLVAPLAGAWIEIKENKSNTNPVIVAPLAGAWIEIMVIIYHILRNMVAPLAGAWIEIGPVCRREVVRGGRSPRGSVD